MNAWASAVPQARGRLDPVVVLRVGLAVAALAAALGAGWLSVAPNRLLPGQPIGALAALGAPAGVVILAATAAAALLRRPISAAFAGAAALALALLATGAAAHALAPGLPSAGRVGLGAGAWVALLALAALAAERARALSRRDGTVLAAALVAALAIAAQAGVFAALSLAVEYAARADQVHAAIAGHVGLAGGAMLLALGLAAPLAFAASRSRRVAAVAAAGLGTIQVVPAIALFGLLVPLLTLLLAAVPGLRALGIAAIGPAPAILATGLYVALPLFHAFRAGLDAAEPGVLEAGRAMGMTEPRLLFDLRLPLGLPLLVGGVRVAAVQSLGLATLGGLVGAGGLGAIVFEGMAQFAADLILLGALPIVALALLADAVLGGLAPGGSGKS